MIREVMFVIVDPGSELVSNRLALTCVEEYSSSATISSPSILLAVVASSTGLSVELEYTDITGHHYRLSAVLNTQNAVCIQRLPNHLYFLDSFRYLVRIALFDRSVSGHHIEYVRYLSKFFTSNGDDVLLITSQTNERVNQLTDLGIELYLVSDTVGWENHIGSLINRTRFLYDAFRKANDWNADILHHLFFDQAELAHLINISNLHTISSPIFVTLFNPRYTKDSSSLFANAFRRLNKHLVHQLFKHNILEGIFVHSQSIKNELENQVGLPKKKIYTIPDPIEPFDQNVGKSEARKRLGICDQGESVFLFFGGFRYDKGIDILLELIPKRDRNDEIFVLAGKPTFVSREDVENIRKRLDNPENVSPHLEYISDEKLPLYFFAADAAILPYREEYTGTSGVLQRTISAKRPVIATNVGEVGDIVSKWGFGVVVQPDSVESLNEGINEFLLNENAYKVKAQENAESYIKQHHWRVFANKVREAYQSELHPLATD